MRCNCNVYGFLPKNFKHSDIHKYLDVGIHEDMMIELKDGKQVNYEGATNVEFSDVGEASGSYKELEIGGGKFNTIQVR